MCLFCSFLGHSFTLEIVQIIYSFDFRLNARENRKEIPLTATRWQFKWFSVVYSNQIRKHFFSLIIGMYGNRSENMPLIRFSYQLMKIVWRWQNDAKHEWLSKKTVSPIICIVWFLFFSYFLLCIGKINPFPDVIDDKIGVAWIVWIGNVHCLIQHVQTKAKKRLDSSGAVGQTKTIRNWSI